MIYESFETPLSLEMLKSILIEHLGVWDVVTETRIEDSQFKGYRRYSWVSRNIHFILGSDVDTHYYDASGFFSQRTVKKLINRMALKDHQWIFRKILTSASEKRRLHLHDVGEYIPYAIMGVVLVASSIIINALEFQIGFDLTILSALSTPLLYGLYRYGIKEDSIDIRLFATGLRWVIAVYGVPATLVVTVIVNHIPLNLNPFLYLPLVMGTWILVNAIFATSIHSSRLIEKKLRSSWSQIRKRFEDDEKVWTPESIPSKGFRLGRIAIMKVLSLFGVAYTMTMLGVYYGIWRYIISFGIFDETYRITVFVVLGVFFLFAMWLSIDLGFTMGLSQIQANHLDSLEISLDSDRVIQFTPIEGFSQFINRMLMDDLGEDRNEE